MLNSPFRLAGEAMPASRRALLGRGMKYENTPPGDERSASASRPHDVADIGAPDETVPLTDAFPENMSRPVAYRGRMTKVGYQPENYQWRDVLCDRDSNGRLVGKDPMEIAVEVLTAAGHGPSRVRGVNQRLAIMSGTDSGEARGDGPRASSLTKIREEVCVGCSADRLSEVRRCGIFDCPAWPYRMGRNPHNPRRGVNPFIREVTP